MFTNTQIVLQEETVTTESVEMSSTEETSVPVEEAPPAADTDMADLTTPAEEQVVEAPPAAEEALPQEQQVSEEAPPVQEEVPEEQAAPAPVQEPEASGKIPQENIKSQLNGIIQDLDKQEPVEYDNTVQVNVIPKLVLS